MALLLCHSSNFHHQMPSSGLCQLCHGFFIGRSSFSELSLQLFCILYVLVYCSGVCFLLSGAKLDAMHSPMGTQPLGFAPLQPFGVYPRQAYMQPGDGPQTHTWYACRVTAPSTSLSRGEPSATQSAVPHPSHLYGGEYNFGGLAESHLIPPAFPMCWGGVFFCRFGAIR